MLISPEEVKKSLSSSGWEYLDKKISKSYEFKTYLDGIDFVQKVASLAENQNHHPNIMIEWCKVQISIHSHQLNGVTTKCVNLATGINLILK